MNTTDYGGYIRVGVDEDISSASSFVMEFTAPSGTSVAKRGTLGITGITGIDGLTANQYVNYQVEENFLLEPGTWEVKLIVNYPSSRRSIDPVEFSIGE